MVELSWADEAAISNKGIRSLQLATATVDLLYIENIRTSSLYASGELRSPCSGSASPSVTCARLDSCQLKLIDALKMAADCHGHGGVLQNHAITQNTVSHLALQVTCQQALSKGWASLGHLPESICQI
jgi:hypothetical protein